MPYLMGDSTMAPLTFRPASNPVQSTDAVQPADSSNDTVVALVRYEETHMCDDDAYMEDVDQHEVEKAKRLTAKNRRKRYLEIHPDYFSDSSLELADPLLYDRLIRRFQTAAEREAEGRRKGFSGQMSTDLWRAEAKKEALNQPNPYSLFVYNRGPNGEILEEDKDDVPMNKEEGKAWWVDEMTQRFLRGDDDDFDYKMVDGNHKYDDPEEERDIQERWFESMDSDFDSDGEGKEKILTGETGIQDY
ncbi:hypothetical protein K505DRAFT_329695 [Melanomma pulvis-pyrius CBS 109.77]|uniref:CCD97-like C-terminal domain-containing protein n=1 Tax=Melanomma pulvis-pyrius CBS 109.77 TaxID=1314802 RepID=A0A6A6WU52_9PLEO|nr:hypothetical protein K505DRAFT_329695 [Melanomma pulvis-pyrius CBS 109.77]